MQMTENRETIEIDLKRVLQTLWSRAWLIVLIGVLCAAMGFGYSYLFMTPQYSASAQLYVNNTYGTNSPGFSSSQLTAAQDLADTYMVILESRNVLDEVAEKTGLNYTYAQLCSMVSAHAVNETEVFEVEVICPNFEHAAQIANAIADVLPEKIAAVVDGSSVRVVDYAIVSDRQVGPSYPKYAIVGFLIGFVLSVGVVIMLDLLDKTISSEDYLSQVYGELPLLAVIPDTENPKTSGYYRGNYSSGQKHQPPKKSGGEK